MRRLTTEKDSENKCVVTRFRRCANVMECRKMKRNSSLNTTNGFISQYGIRLSNYMFRPALVAIVRLNLVALRVIQMLAGRVVMRSQ